MGVNVGSAAVLEIGYSRAVFLTGTGWAQTSGRIAAIGTPIVAGALLALKIPPRWLDLSSTFPFYTAAMARITLAVSRTRRLLGSPLDEFPPYLI
jgi:hypothetical protein